MDKRVLIITYYWPPSGGSGVQRWLKFVKYLPSLGWQPFVFTPENPSFDIKDHSLLKEIPPEAEVIKLPIWEPYRLFNKLSGWFTGNKKPVAVDAVSPSGRSAFHQLAAWVRSTFFIPDPRIFWVRPSTAFLHDFIRERKISTIITTGPPHSMHLIGLRLKKKNPDLHWITDFRDPWSEWGLWEKLGTGKLAMSRHKKLERKVLTHADVVVSVTPFYVERFKKLSGREVALITNGFDEEDVRGITHQRPHRFTIRHIGIVNEQRDPIPFMNAVLDLITKKPELQNEMVIEFVGEVYAPFKEFVNADRQLTDMVTFTGNVPHAKVMELYGSTSLLLLILSGYRDQHGFYPGKVFEYMATGVPVLGVGPEGDAANLLRESGSGVMIRETDKEEIKSEILRNYQMWIENKTLPSTRQSLQPYSRKNLTQELVKLMK